MRQSYRPHRPGANDGSPQPEKYTAPQYRSRTDFCNKIDPAEVAGGREWWVPLNAAKPEAELVHLSTAHSE
jgi:hypothetical protein